MQIRSASDERSDYKRKLCNLNVQRKSNKQISSESFAFVSVRNKYVWLNLLIAEQQTTLHKLCAMVGTLHRYVSNFKKRHLI